MINTIILVSSIFSAFFSFLMLIIEIQRSVTNIKKRKQKLIQRSDSERKNSSGTRGKKVIQLLFLAISCVAIIFTIAQLVALVKFEFAVDMMNNGDFERAQAIFVDLDENALYMQSRYSYAKQLYERGNWEDAALIFAELGDYNDSKQYLSSIQSANQSNSNFDIICEESYILACDFYEKGQYGRALKYYRELIDYKDSQDLAASCLKMLRAQLAHMISAGIRTSVGISSDGTVVSTGNRNAYDYHDWADIISISNKGAITIGLKEDGTVVSTGEYPVDVSTWSDIIAVSAGEQYVVGLKSDGTVLGVGHDAGDGQLNVGNWTDIVDIATGWRHTVGLDIDGAVFITGYGSSKQLKEISANYEEWKNIIAIAAGGGNVAGKGHTVGLRTDGKVVAVGDNTYGQCNVGDWDNIVAIAAGDWHTVGLRADGTVVSTRPNSNKYPDLYTGACDVDSWTDIVQIAAGSGYTLGLRSDGSVVAVGYNDEGKSTEVENWGTIKIAND